MKRLVCWRLGNACGLSLTWSNRNITLLSEAIRSSNQSRNKVEAGDLEFYRLRISESCHFGRAGMSFRIPFGKDQRYKL